MYCHEIQIQIQIHAIHPTLYRSIESNLHFQTIIFDSKGHLNKIIFEAIITLQ